jgi:hypothetical protein
MRYTSNVIRSWLATASILGSMTMASHAGPGDAQVLPINSNPYGKSYGQWAVAWWQWAFSIPAATNPLLDTTGEFAGVGQSGPVWFLGGTFADSAERTFSVPSGKAIFLPVHQWIFGSCAGDCDPTNPGVPCDVPTLRASAAAAATAVTVMEVSIDGRAIAHLNNFRAPSPDSFSVNLPPGNVVEFLGLTAPAGIYDPQVTDGYWLMLAPLNAGAHTIRIHSVNPSFGLNYTLVCHIQVTAGKSGSAPSKN